MKKAVKGKGEGKGIRGNPAKIIPFQIKKGEKRNPKGSSKTQREHMDFKRWIQTNMADSPAEVFKKLAQLASKGKDMRAITEYLDRYQGKAPNKMLLGNADGEPLALSVTVMTPEAQKRLELLKKKLAG